MLQPGQGIVGVEPSHAGGARVRVEPSRCANPGGSCDRRHALDDGRVGPAADRYEEPIHDVLCAHRAASESAQGRPEMRVLPIRPLRQRSIATSLVWDELSVEDHETRPVSAILSQQSHQALAEAVEILGVDSAVPPNGVLRLAECPWSHRNPDLKGRDIFESSRSIQIAKFRTGRWAGGTALRGHLVGEHELLPTCERAIPGEANPRKQRVYSSASPILTPVLSDAPPSGCHLAPTVRVRAAAAIGDQIKLRRRIGRRRRCHDGLLRGGSARRPRRVPVGLQR